LIIKLGIEPSELLSSWLTRLANENTMMVAGLLSTKGLEKYVQTDFDLHAHPNLITSLAETGLYRSRQIRLQRAMISGWGERSGSLKQCMRRWILPGGHRSSKLRYCPCCLQEAAYFRKSWRINWYAGCHRHKVILQDKCPACLSPQVLYKTSWRFPVGYCTSCQHPLLEAKRIPFDDEYYWQTVALSFNSLRTSTPKKEASAWFQVIWVLANWLEKIRRDDKPVNLFLSKPLIRLRMVFPEAVAFHQARILWDKEPFILQSLISEYQFEFDRITYKYCPRPLKQYRRSKDWRIPSVEQLEVAIRILLQSGDKITYLRISEVAKCAPETIRKYEHLDKLVRQHVCPESVIRLRS